MAEMKKKLPIKHEESKHLRKIEAPVAQAKKLPAVDEFTYKKFERIADKVTFTQKEWAQILHLSERTLQRYAANNTAFEGIYTDRILHLQQLIELGLETFTSPEAFYTWLKKEKNVTGHTLTFESLYSTQGIQSLIDQLTRIQYGVYT